MPREEQNAMAQSKAGMPIGLPAGSLMKDSYTVLESGKSLHEHSHSRTDSGFLSGGNLTSSDDLCSTPLSQKSIPEFPEPLTKGTYMRLDSGVDVGLHEPFSNLSLCKDTSPKLNDLNSVKCVEKFRVQPWELYFQQDDDGDTQLHIAIIQGFHEVVYSLIRMAPHRCLLDILNGVIQAPLHLAVLTRQPRIVRQLAVFGADVTRRDAQGNTALHLACQIGDMECIRALTEPVTVAEIATAGVSVAGLTPQLPPDLDEFNYQGETCVHLAAKSGHLDVLRHLLWFGADVNAREAKSGRTILHMAVESSDASLLRFLLEECPTGGSSGGAGLLLDMPTYAGHSAYQLAAMINPMIARELLARGATLADDIDYDDHPDHNAEEDERDSDEDEVIEMDSIPSGLGSYPRKEVPVL